MNTSSTPYRPHPLVVATPPRLHAAYFTTSNREAACSLPPQQHNDIQKIDAVHLDRAKERLYRDASTQKGAEPGIEPGTSPILRESIKLPGMNPKGELYH
jgi:hypothetical protein